jgi:hypothetical protein
MKRNNRHIFKISWQLPEGLKKHQEKLSGQDGHLQIKIHNRESDCYRFANPRDHKSVQSSEPITVPKHRFLLASILFPLPLILYYAISHVRFEHQFYASFKAMRKDRSFVSAMLLVTAFKLNLLLGTSYSNYSHK